MSSLSGFRVGLDLNLLPPTLILICFFRERFMFLFQAIELAAESLANVKFIQEKKLIGRWLNFFHQWMYDRKCFSGTLTRFPKILANTVLGWMMLSRYFWSRLASYDIIGFHRHNHLTNIARLWKWALSKPWSAGRISISSGLVTFLF